MKLPGAGTEERPAAHVLKFARECYPTSKGFQRAVVRGFYGRRAGRTRDENPYRGRTAGGTFTFAWRAAWERGWHHGGR